MGAPGDDGRFERLEERVSRLLEAIAATAPPGERNYIAQLERDMEWLEHLVLGLVDRMCALEAKVTRLETFSLGRPDPTARKPRK